MQEKFALIYTKKTSSNNIVVLKKSRIIGDKKLKSKSKEKKRPKKIENKRSIISLGVKKQYTQDD